MSLNVLIKAPGGKTSVVTEKAFYSIYQARGFELIAEQPPVSIEPGEMSPKMPEPEFCPHCGQLMEKDAPRSSKRIYAPATGNAAASTGETITSAAKIAENLNLIGDRTGQPLETKLETPLTRPQRPTTRRNFPLNVNDNGRGGDLIEHKKIGSEKIADENLLKAAATQAGMPVAGVPNVIPGTFVAPANKEALETVKTESGKNESKTKIDGDNLETKRTTGKAGRNDSKKRSNSGK